MDRNIAYGRSVRRLAVASLLGIAASAAAVGFAAADEGGVSFWTPGFFGSLAAAPLQPGFSFTSMYYHTSPSAAADVAVARQVSRGNLTADVVGNLSASLNASADLGFFIPSYTFAEPVLGGQASVLLVVPAGRSRASVDATFAGAAGPIPITVSGERTDTTTGFSDLIPQFNLRWNVGVHNFMTYITGDIPVGNYDSTRLANLGIGHGAIDGGGGYTYFNPQTGHELSGSLGFTYNFENTTTQYQNGVDMHFDWAASQFLTKQLHVGLVGYAYQQLTGDSGSGDLFGDFKSRVFGVGPQVGYIFPLGDHQGYLNLKGYKEFDAEHRADGWNVWLTLAISPAAAPPPARPMVAK
jgi:hypothetical protein